MIVAGFGFRAAATVDSLRDALARAGTAQAIATLPDKADTAVFRAFATAVKLPVIQVNPDAIHKVHTITTSEYSQNNKGTGSVSEACGLAAAGAGARLIAPRVISADRMATCALAISPDAAPDTGATP